MTSNFQISKNFNNIIFQNSPAKLGELCVIDYNFINVRMYMVITNRLGSGIDFTAVPPVNAADLWIEFYDINGKRIDPVAGGFKYVPENYVVSTAPSSTVANDADMIFDITLGNMFFYKPVGAVYYKLNFSFSSVAVDSEPNASFPIKYLYFTQY